MCWFLPALCSTVDILTKCLIADLPVQISEHLLRSCCYDDFTCSGHFSKKLLQPLSALTEDNENNKISLEWLRKISKDDSYQQEMHKKLCFHWFICILMKKIPLQNIDSLLWELKMPWQVTELNSLKLN